MCAAAALAWENFTLFLKTVKRYLRLPFRSYWSVTVLHYLYNILSDGIIITFITNRFFFGPAVYIKEAQIIPALTSPIKSMLSACMDMVFFTPIAHTGLLNFSGKKSNLRR